MFVPEKNDRTTDSPLPPIIASNGVTPCPPLVLPEEPTEYTTPPAAAAVVDQGVTSGENVVVNSGDSPKEEVKEDQGTADISEEASEALEAPPAIHDVSLVTTTHEVSLATTAEATEATIEATSIEQDTSSPMEQENLPAEEDQPADVPIETTATVVPSDNTATTAAVSSDAVDSSVVVPCDDATPEGLLPADNVRVVATAALGVVDVVCALSEAVLSHETATLNAEQSHETEQSSPADIITPHKNDPSLVYEELETPAVETEKESAETASEVVRKVEIESEIVEMESGGESENGVEGEVVETGTESSETVSKVVGETGKVEIESKMSEVIESEVIESEMVDSEMVDNEVVGNEVIDSEVIDSEVVKVEDEVVENAAADSEVVALSGNSESESKEVEGDVVEGDLAVSSGNPAAAIGGTPVCSELGEVQLERAKAVDAGTQTVAVKIILIDEGVVDKGVVDEGVVDDGVVDEGVVDEGVVDERVVDEGVVDEGVVDEGVVDDGVVGEGVVDEGVVDEGVVDEGVVGEGVVDEGVVDEEVVDEGVVDIEAEVVEKETEVVETGSEACCSETHRNEDLSHETGNTAVLSEPTHETLADIPAIDIPGNPAEPTHETPVNLPADVTPIVNPSQQGHTSPAVISEPVVEAVVTCEGFEEALLSEPVETAEVAGDVAADVAPAEETAPESETIPYQQQSPTEQTSPLVTEETQPQEQETTSSPVETATSSQETAVETSSQSQETPAAAETAQETPAVAAEGSADTLNAILMQHYTMVTYLEQHKANGGVLTPEQESYLAQMGAYRASFAQIAAAKSERFKNLEIKEDDLDDTVPSESNQPSEPAVGETVDRPEPAVEEPSETVESQQPQTEASIPVPEESESVPEESVAAPNTETTEPPAVETPAAETTTPPAAVESTNVTADSTLEITAPVLPSSPVLPTQVELIQPTTQPTCAPPNASEITALTTTLQSQLPDEEDGVEQGGEEDDVQMWSKSGVDLFIAEVSADPDSILSVGRGETVTVRIPTYEAGSALYWEFATENYDIGFGASFEWEEEGEGEEGEDGVGEKKTRREAILPILRRSSHEKVITGSHAYPRPGTYLLMFDNSYSLLRSKTVFYRVFYTR
eukprot:sb/3461354/